MIVEDREGADVGPRSMKRKYIYIYSRATAAESSLERTSSSSKDCSYLGRNEHVEHSLLMSFKDRESWAGGSTRVCN